MIPFNKPYISGNEIKYIQESIDSASISGNGPFTKKCQEFFETKYGFKKCLLTNSCTDALEMAAILIGINQGDEVIVPSYTFVSTANAFVLRGAKIIFADSKDEHPNIDVSTIEALISPKTKAIVIDHYGGMACDMDEIMSIANAHNIFVVEDAAQAIDGYYKGSPLGGIGHFGTFSFHATKNISSGEGGMLVINDDQFIERAEIIWEKGTNRSAFFRNEVEKYGWVDIGSSFLPSDLTAAFLWAQLEQLDNIQNKRVELWNNYQQLFFDIKIEKSNILEHENNNGHVFYIVCHDKEERKRLIQYLSEHNIQANFHFQSLHTSSYFMEKHDERDLPNSDRYSNCLLRLPLYYDLEYEQQVQIANRIKSYYAEYVSERQ